MAIRQNSSIAIVFILGLLVMLISLSIDMYLPALPVISGRFGVLIGSVQMTLSIYILGFAVGQPLYGLMAGNIGRKPVVLDGTLAPAATAVACALVQIIDQLIAICPFHGLAAVTASVVTNALMCDTYPKEEFPRMMSFIVLVTTIAPLSVPIVGGWVLVWLSWHRISWIFAMVVILASVMILALIKETLSMECRQPFCLRTTIDNFAPPFRHKQALSYMLASGFNFAGMFLFLSVGPFAYIEINHVSPQHFSYYFALNIAFLFMMAIINSHFVHWVGALNMLRTGLWIQFVVAGWMVSSALLGLGFWALVMGVAALVDCVSMVSSNAMVVILDEFPYVAGTVLSLAGTFRLGTGAIAGTLLSLATLNSAWPMIWSAAFCAIHSTFFYLYASRTQKR